METGCIIDGSNISSTEFMISVIEFAHDLGFEMEYYKFAHDCMNLTDEEYDMDVEELEEILDSIDWTYEDAIDYINNNISTDQFFFVKDQCLYLEDVDASE